MGFRKPGEKLKSQLSEETLAPQVLMADELALALALPVVLILLGLLVVLLTVVSLPRRFLRDVLLCSDDGVDARGVVETR